MKDTIERVLIVMIFCIIFFIFGIWLGVKSAQEVALKAKVAEYYIDENNNKQFRFKEIK